jgi:predicted enzyme related to lactoylglutathione lyase
VAPVDAWRRPRARLLSVRSVTVDCADPYRQARFWSQVTGWQEDPDDPNQPDDPEGRIVAGQGFSLLFIPVPEAKVVKNRMHLDLLPTNRSRDEEVERLLGIGATLVEDHRKADGAGWVTLADPEGNEFCVERSQRERGQV